MNIRRVVVILDQPNRPQTALKRALRMQKDSGDELTLEPVAFIYDAFAEANSGFDAKERKQLKKRTLERHKAWLDELADQYPTLPEVRTVWEHHLDDWVKDNCASADLVIKTASGSARSRSASDWALLMTCPTNLLLVGHRRIRQPQKVLAALDLQHRDTLHDKLNQRVLDMAASVASLSAAELHTACAVEVMPALIDLDVINERTAQRKQIKKSASLLDRLVAAYGVKKKHRHFPVGRIGQAIADCVKANGADLLVVGTRARPVRQALGLGNSAQRILRKAPCDLLAVRPG